jgi:hypothetical protein
MSIDVEIIPTSASPISWQRVRQRLMTYPLPEAARGLLGDQPQLITAGSHRVVAESDLLLPRSVYEFKLPQDNTLGLDIQTNAETYTNEADYLDDFARNLQEAQRRTLAQQWQAVGFSYEVTSTGGRNRNEAPLLVALAAILAELCSGHILILSTGPFSLPVGCYTPQQVREANTYF